MHSDSDSKVEPFELCKSGNFWQEQLLDLVPLIAAIAVTRSMGIRGFPGIPIYLIVANASRWLIRYGVPASPQAAAKRVSPTSSSDTVHGVNCTVLHAIPRRIRLRVPLISEDIAYGRRLEKLLKTDDLVVDVRLNYQTASIIITHKSAEISLSHWIKWLEMAKREVFLLDAIHTTHS
jgi:hypothetical protein